MTFGNLLSVSAERNPRRAAIVLEKESISHVLRPHAAPYRNSPATPSPRTATGIKREGRHNWREMCRPGIQHALACADRTAQFIASFDVPHSLKDVGVSRNEIQQIVPAVLHEVKERAVVHKPITEAEVVALLEASH